MLQGCTQEQRQAAEHGEVLSGGGVRSTPQLIIAGAGTGKTNTLAQRAAFLILNGVDPQRILLMTFSRRAANELSLRAQRIVGQALKQQARDNQSSIASPSRKAQADAAKSDELSWMGTFHSIANRLLRHYASRIGLDPDFSIIDRSDAADMMDILRHQLELTQQSKRFPKKGTCIEIYSRCVNSQESLPEILTRDFPWCADWADELKQLFRAYTELKQKQLSLDYDDLLLYWFHLASEGDVAEKIRGLFDHVLVDEYQDTNKLQAGIVHRLFPDGQGVTVVGDDAQSIYAFRAADVDNILSFPQAFSPAAKVYPLTENFRSVQPILDLSNAILSESKEGYQNLLHSKKSSAQQPQLVSVENAEMQSKYIIEKILESRECGIELKRQAVLYRSSHHTDQLEIELRRHDIPFVKHGGLKFLEAAHVKDALCLLRWADNPKHRLSGFRVLKLLPGVGPKLAEKVLDHLELNEFSFTALEDFKSTKLKGESWTSLVTLLQEVHCEKIPWVEQMQRVWLWYQPLLEVLYEDPYARGGDIEQLAMISQQSLSRERFLSELILDPPSSSGGLCVDSHKDDDFLILSTIHSAKGQEWHDVFLLNVADGNFPNEYAIKDPKALEEERRLFYVALTRAQQNLHLVQPLKYWVPEQQRFGGKHVYGAKSRFLTPTVLSTLEAVPYPDTRLTDADIAAGEKVLTDIKAKVMGLWD
ncbi:MAG: ATP-dependent helicase [Cellvibrionaceae bacterium]